jgi:iron complex transport system substrate-binding protein
VCWTQVGRALGLATTSDAQRVWLRIETALGTIAQSIPPRSRGARVYFEVGSGPLCGERGVVHR